MIGFAGLLAMVIALVVDSTSAYLQRQGLDTLADGAALEGADLGATGAELYLGGVPPERLALTASRARAAVAHYLQDAGAYAHYPGLSFTVRIDGDRLEVAVRAPLELPLGLPGAPRRAVVGATGSAIVGLDGAGSP